MTVQEFNEKIRALYDEFTEGYKTAQPGDQRNVCLVAWYPEQDHAKILLPPIGLTEAAKMMISAQETINSKFTHLIGLSNSILCPDMSSFQTGAREAQAVS